MTTESLLDVVVLTRDEEANIQVLLRSIAALPARVFVVDSGSRDRTVPLCMGAGCTVVTHPFTNHAEQLNWALKNLPLQSPWTMRLDADERVMPELVAELRERLPVAPETTKAFLLKRRVYFWGKWIRHGGYYPTWLLRVWRRGEAISEQRFMDEHMVVLSGSTGRLDADIIDENHKGLTFWTEKHNQYATREVADIIARTTTTPSIRPGGQAGVRRWLKENLYLRSPLFLRAVLYWAFRYFGRCGFLDGRPGLVFHLLQGLWYRFLVDAKLEEIARTAGTDNGDKRRG